MTCHCTAVDSEGLLHVMITARSVLEVGAYQQPPTSIEAKTSSSGSSRGKTRLGIPLAQQLCQPPSSSSEFKDWSLGPARGPPFHRLLDT
eukprot:3060607-Amphidinium_carterae.1